MVTYDVVQCRELVVGDKFALAAAKTPTAAGGSFTITDWVTLAALDCDTDAVALTNRVLGTLIKALIDKGIITGTVSA